MFQVRLDAVSNLRPFRPVMAHRAVPEERPLVAK